MITDPFKWPLKSPGTISDVSRPSRRIKTPVKRLRKQQEGIRGGDWFGCGRVITAESWKGFLKAQREYWEAQDKKTT